jgi:hypothetical protein
MKRIIMTGALALMIVSVGCNRAASSQPPEIANTVDGSFTFDGETVKVSHAYASLVKNEKDDRKQNVMIVFTDRPAPWRVIDQDETGLHWDMKKKAGQGELKGFSIMIAQDKTVSYDIYYQSQGGSGVALSDDEEYTPAKAEFKPVSFTSTLVQGNVSAKSEKPADPEKAENAPNYQFDATFKVSLKPDKWTGVFYKSPPTNVAPGRASGKLVVDGKVMSINHAYAHQSGYDLFEETNVEFILTEKPLPPEALKDASFSDILRAAHKAGNSHVISRDVTTREPPKDPIVWALADPQNPDSWDYESLTAEVDLSQLDARAIDGKIYTRDPYKRHDHTYEVNVSFNAPVITTGDTMDGPVTANNGKPLPVGGGAPGTAYLMFVRAVPTVNSLKELSQLLEASQSVRVFGETKKSLASVQADKEKEALAVLKSILAIKDARVDGGFWTEGKATLWVSGTDEGKSASARVNMHLENNGWKVGQGSTRVQ